MEIKRKIARILGSLLFIINDYSYRYGQELLDYGMYYKPKDGYQWKKKENK